jgi:glyoxylase-like metal-dependent hydrolase (beta-lactamase superfamily II)
VWLAKERVLCTGDAAVNGPYNKLLDADMANWPKAIGQAQKFKPTYVLPGHGPAGGPEVLTGQKRFLEDLYSGVKAAIAQGKTLDQIHLTLPEADKSWIPKSLDQDVQVTYQEITQHTPAGDIPHQWK